MAITRRALLISNPGEVGDEHYCKGVPLDIANYQRMLRSAHGGTWQANEIESIDRPTAQDVRVHVAALAAYDYSLIAFAGHGYFSSIDRLTVLKLRKGVELSSAELYKDAVKRTIVLDCCREIKNKSALLIEKRADFSAASIEEAYRRRPDPLRCRAVFDQRIVSASPARIVIESCSPGETAGDDERTGGYYTFNFIGSADLWADKVGGNPYATVPDAFSVVGAHDAAALKTIEDSRERDRNKIQNPTISKPRTLNNYFPFAVFA